LETLGSRSRGIIPLTATPERDDPPAGWRWRTLTDLARLETGHTPSRYQPSWWGGDIPWIALPDIRALDGKVAFDTLEHTNSEGIANSSARVLPTNTVVLSRTASVGFVTIMGRPMATSQDFVNWVCGEELNPFFLMYLFQAAREYIRAIAEGAIHKTVYMPAVRRFEVCTPTRAVQDRIVAALQRQMALAEKAVEAAVAELEAANLLPAAILRRGFSGDIR
jgi:type I restriction enzyme S subunit